MNLDGPIQPPKIFHQLYSLLDLFDYLVYLLGPILFLRTQIIKFGHFLQNSIY